MRPEGSTLGVRPEGSTLGVRPEGSTLGVNRMDFFAGQRAMRRHSMDYGNDEQHVCHSAGCHAEKTPFHVPILAKQTTSGL
jgi:hypothetical protein